MEIFKELARIFCEDNNQWAQRELLIKEGTAKFADTVGENDRHLQKIIQRQFHNCGVSKINELILFAMFYFERLKKLRKSNNRLLILYIQKLTSHFLSPSPSQFKCFEGSLLLKEEV